MFESQPRGVALAFLALPFVLAACGGGTTSSPSTDASLSALTPSAGSLSPAFASGVTGYTLQVAHGTAGVTFTATATATTVSAITLSRDGGTPVALTSGAASASVPVPAFGVSSVITIVVTAADGTTTRTYTVTLSQAGSDDASLSGLAVSAGTLVPAFDPLTLAYAVVVPNGVTTLTVTPTANDAAVTSITITQDGSHVGTVASGNASPDLTVPAVGASTVIAVTVVSQDGLGTVEYSVEVSQAAATDASLASLVPSLGSLAPAFGAGVTSYTLVVPHGTASLTLTPTASNAAVTSISVSQDATPVGDVTSGSATSDLAVPAVGSTSTVSLLVTAQDGTTTREYTVVLSQAASSVATLAGLALSQGALAPAFSATVTSYTAVIGHAVASITVTPTATDPAADAIAVYQDGSLVATVATGSPSPALAVPDVGSTSTVSVIVTAQDTSTTAQYDVVLSQAPAQDASLAALALSDGTLTPSFDAAVIDYATLVAHGIATITVTPTATDPDVSSITVFQDATLVATLDSGETSPALDVPAYGAAASLVTVVVMAQDGTTTVTYTIHVSGGPDTDPALATLVASSGTFNPVFDADTLAYTWTVPSDATTVTLTPTARATQIGSITVDQDGAGAQPVTNGAASQALTVLAFGSSSIVTIVATAQDGSTTRTYTLHLERAPQNNTALASLLPSNGVLSPAFVAETLVYDWTVAVNATTVTLTPTARASAVASITVDQDGAGAQLVQNGAASQDLTVLPYGSASTITIVVTAEDGTTTSTYTLHLVRAALTDAALATLTPSAGSFSPVFAAETASYDWTVPATATTVTVTPTARAAFVTSISVDQDGAGAQLVASGNASQSLVVPAFGASSTITIVVIAQDGTTTGTYTLHLGRAPLTDPALAALAPSAGTLTPDFTADGLTYDWMIPSSFSTVTLTPTARAAAVGSIQVAQDAGAATVVANGSPSQALTTPALTATSTVTVLVTAQDGSTRTYTLTLARALPGLATPRTVPVTASTPLAVAAGATLPANNTSEVPVDTLLRIGFDAAPTLGASGTIQIRESSTTNLVDSINLADTPAVYSGSTKYLSNAASSKVNIIGGGASQVRVANYVPLFVNGNTVTIVPHNYKLKYGTSYYVTIDNGVLNGTIQGAAFVGITDATTWMFTTKTATPTTYNVAADDTADFATVQGAIDAAPAGSTINIAAGVYQELLFIRSKNNLTLKGADNLTTVLQYDNCDGFNPGTGQGTAVTGGSQPGTVPVLPSSVAAGGRALLLVSSSSGLVLDSITLKNLHAQGSMDIPTVPAVTTITTTTSPTFTGYTSSVTQAETLYFNASNTQTMVAKHSNFVSFQDTIQIKGFTWFYDCFITGDTDFIWGAIATAVFEDCELQSRYNVNGGYVVNSRAYLPTLGTASTAPTTGITSGYAGYVFIGSAFTRDSSSVSAYLARSQGPLSVSGSSPSISYYGYDDVALINCSLDAHILPAGWATATQKAGVTGANVDPSAVIGWREYGSMTPTGGVLDVSQRLLNHDTVGTTTGFGSIQLGASDVATFFPDRMTILHGATDGTLTTVGLSTFSPAP